MQHSNGAYSYCMQYVPLHHENYSKIQLDVPLEKIFHILLIHRTIIWYLLMQRDRSEKIKEDDKKWKKKGN